MRFIKEDRWWLKWLFNYRIDDTPRLYSPDSDHSVELEPVYKHEGKWKYDGFMWVRVFKRYWKRK